MDRFEAMTLLLAVVDHGSFTGAGQAMRVPVPTLSRKISELETQLGTQLLRRTTRRLSLTDAGIAYVAAARRILEQVEEAEREASGEYVAPRGELVLTAPLLFGRLHVLPLVTEFLALFPEINVRLLLADRNVDLVGDHVDMAVRVGALPDSGLVATRIGELRMVVAACPRLLAAHGAPTTPDALRSLPCVGMEAGVSALSWHVHDPETRRVIDVPVVPRLTTTTVETAVEAAVRGVGAVRALSYQVADAVRDGALHVILEEWEPEPLPVHLVHATRGQMPLKMRRFLDFAAPRLREAIAAIKPASKAARE